MEPGNRRAVPDIGAPPSCEPSPLPGDVPHQAAPGRVPGGGWRRTLRGHRYFLLMLLLVGGLALESVAKRPVWVSAASEALLGAALFAMVLVVFAGRRSRSLALWYWLAVTTLGWTLYLLPAGGPTWPKVLQLLMLAFLHGWAGALILRDIFQQPQVDKDAVFGAVTGYLLAAGGWGNLYALCELAVPGSFHVDPDLAGSLANPQTRNAMFIYFSLATITTVGFGDVTPAQGPITVLVMMEAVFGQFYIAVVVAQLVGMRLAQITGGRQGGP